MNLHRIVSPIIAAINPPVIGSIRYSTGSVVTPSGDRTPGYAQVDGISMQVQAMSQMELQHIDALGIQGTTRAVYLNGSVEGANRLLGSGGDILIFGGCEWLVTAVMEPWDTAGWTKVAVTQQEPSAR